MGILVNTGFDVGSSSPIDNRTVKETTLERDALVTDGYVYEGMEVYCKDTKVKYRWTGTEWETVVSSGSGTAIDDTQASDTTTYSSNKIEADYQRITDNTLTTTAKTVPGAINELLNLINEKVALPELDGVENDVLTRDADGNVIWKAIPDVDLSGKLDKPAVDGTAGQVLTVQEDGTNAYQDVPQYDDTELQEAVANKLDKPETDGTAGQILVLQDNGSLAYADNVSEYDDTAIQEELDTKLDKPEVEGTTGQILVVQDDGSLAYADNVSEYDDTAIQEAMSNKLDKPETEGTVGQILVVQDDGTLAYQDNVTKTPIATVDTVGTVKPDGTTIIIDEDGIITAVGDGEGGASTADAVEYVNDAISVTNVEDALNKLISDFYYVAPSITSFTASPNGGVFEIGTTITAPTFNWNYNKDITIQTLTDCTLADETIRTATYNSDITTDRTFTLFANDGKNNVSKSISYTFVSPYYTGVSATDTVTETDIIALTKKVETKGNKTISYTTSQSYMVFAYPKSYGAIKSVIDKNGFEVVSSFTSSTVSINGVDYYVFCSNQCSGSYTMLFKY